MLDKRLGLVYDLYEKCDNAADIGTDHGLLPCALLKSDKCRRMILTDISDKALSHARDTIARARLDDRVRFACGDGLAPIEEKCDFISITGMGGKTIAQMIENGRNRLQSAALILSAHTDLPFLREAVMNIGYHFDREELCYTAGRYYLIFRAVPGKQEMTPAEIRRGSLLFEKENPCMASYLQHRADVLKKKLSGLLTAVHADTDILKNVTEDIRFYEERIAENQ